MPEEPSLKRAIAFFDGQNLFHSAKTAFGYSYPNYDPVALAASICSEYGWTLEETRFYTGLPSQAKDPSWYHFWETKLAGMGRQGVKHYIRPLRYRTEKVRLADGTTENITTRQEKGIDVRLALEIVRLALDNKYDVALVFSQDQDLSEVADEIKAISELQDRWIQVASAFPVGDSTTNKRGIERTKWITIEKSLYESCLDHTDYRPATVASIEKRAARAKQIALESASKPDVQFNESDRKILLTECGLTEAAIDKLEQAMDTDKAWLTLSRSRPTPDEQTKILESLHKAIISLSEQLDQLNYFIQNDILWMEVRKFKKISFSKNKENVLRELEVMDNILAQVPTEKGKAGNKELDFNFKYVLLNVARIMLESGIKPIKHSSLFKKVLRIVLITLGEKESKVRTLIDKHGDVVDQLIQCPDEQTDFD